MDTERTSPLRDADQSGQESWLLLGERGELVDDEDEPRDRAVRTFRGPVRVDVVGPDAGEVCLAPAQFAVQ